jgi:hypothetical protein
MTAYNYTRELISEGLYEGKWDIPNPERLATEDRSKYLENEIIAAVAITKSLSPGCSMICNGATCTINFTETLDSAEKMALDALVAAHKNNT